MRSFADLAIGEQSRKRKIDRSASSLHTFSDSGTASSLSGSKASLLVAHSADLEQRISLAQSAINDFRETLAFSRTVATASVTVSFL